MTIVQKPEQNYFPPKKSATYKINEFRVDLFRLCPGELYKDIKYSPNEPAYILTP